MRKLTLGALVIMGWNMVNAQDTISVMQYNLLYYGNYYDDCTPTNNNPSEKDVHLRTIIDYVKPDIFAVNELGVEFVGLENKYGKRILDSVLNVNGVTHYQKALHTGGSFLVNMLYYNSDKLVLHKQDYITKDSQNNNLVREIDFYTLYYNDSALSQHNDTIFLTCAVAHLKAGSNQSDQTEREDAATAVMDYFSTMGKGNYLMMGDFNIGSPLEGSFQQFINYSNVNLRFYDPINQIGEWSANSSYSAIHTQSTRSSSDADSCFVGGGMDDRFDFILASDAVLNSGNGVKYVSGSYKAVGQDGTSCCNSSLNTVNNSTVPPSVATALYNMSDHLPVKMDLILDHDLGSLIVDKKQNDFEVKFNNPFNNELLVQFIKQGNTPVSISIYDLSGARIAEHHNITETSVSLSMPGLKKGIYLMRVRSGESSGNYKVVKM